MNNGDMPANPLPNGADNRPHTFMKDEKIQPNHAAGLTKREHFAGLAMQAMISKFGGVKSINCREAVEMANALLKELEK